MSEQLDGPCYWCHGMTESFAGNPGKWPLRFCYGDNSGIVKWHHVDCVTHMLRDREKEMDRIKQEASTPSSGGIRAKSRLMNNYLGERPVSVVKLEDAEALEHECLRWQATADRHEKQIAALKREHNKQWDRAKLAERELRDAEEREQELETHLSQFQQANDKAATEWHRLNEQLIALRAEKEAVERAATAEQIAHVRTKHKLIKATKYKAERDQVWSELAAARQEQERHRVQLASYFCEVHLPEPDEPGPDQCLCCDAAGFAKQWTEAKQEQERLQGERNAFMRKTGELVERYEQLVTAARSLSADWVFKTDVINGAAFARELDALLPPVTGEKGKE